MDKNLILIASPPASGKTYVCEHIAKALGQAVYLDKDDLTLLVRAAFSVAGREFDMDGEFYKKNLRDLEYQTLMHIAFSNLRFENCVLVNAPLGKEIRSSEYMKALKEKANANGARLMLIWVSSPSEICRERMTKRGSDRDTLKLASWEDYVKNINYTPPYELKKCGAVDDFLVFDNKDEKAFDESMKKALGLIKRHLFCGNLQQKASIDIKKDTKKNL